MVHASPRIIGTPQVSASGGQRSISQIAMTSPAGPEKPQRYVDFIVLLILGIFKKKFTFNLKNYSFFPKKAFRGQQTKIYQSRKSSTRGKVPGSKRRRRKQ